MKTCSECKSELAIESFPKRSSRCKPCHNAYTREHYQKNKQYYKDKARKHNEQIRDRVRAAKEKPCADCGIQYPYYVMHFDHLGDKEFNIAHRAKGGAWADLEKEIAKCEVVCANCHAFRTHNRSVAKMI
ncbi:HNH endonuclease [Streptomyces phage Spilled]|nr:HNH endonuclease [Streptomyces phage Wipeout]QGH79042.1 HNH endonuclease [Streptomyces phage TomSawyer]UVK60050.1 HNH endonuclease [Streptomyces phage Spilled]UVK61004.1 HNH endonuclease [Streptomyces phage JimJam]